MNVGVLLLTWNAADAALACLETLMQQNRMPDVVLAVDNASEDGTPDQIVRRFPDVTLVRNEHNLGFARGMNRGIEVLRALPEPPAVVVLLNQDTLLQPDWLDEIVTPLADPQVGMVGCKILYPDGTIQHAGKFLEWPRAVAQHLGWHEHDHGQYDQQRTADDLTAAALALRMTALDEVGLFDPGYTPAYYEDSDLCWRLRQAGYQLVYQPKAVLIHAESQSISATLTRSKYYNRGRLRFVLKTYAFADIVGPFATSEYAFIAQHGRRDEARALRWAYIETIAALPEIVQARAQLHPLLNATEIETIQQLLFDWKRALSTALQRRARNTLATL